MYSRIFLLLLISSIYSQAILHYPIDEFTEQTPVLVEAFIDLPDYEVKNVTLFYRPRGEVKYVETPMFKIDTEYLGEIPASFVQMRGIEYFLIVDTYTMGFLGLPNIDPTNNPFRIDVNKKKEYLSNITLSEFDPKFTILSPEPDMEIIDEDVMISLSYFQMDNIDNNEIKVFIDDIEVSNAVDFRFNHFVYYPESMNEGIRKVKVILADNFGVEYNPIEWSFLVTKQKNISMFDFEQSGKFKTDYTNSIVDTTSLYEKTADFAYNAKFSWLDFRTNIHLSSLENDLEQPKNRFYADFKSEFFRLRVGDVYPNLGENFIKRNRIRGLDFNIDKEKYKFNFVSGDIIRSTQGSPFDGAMKISNISIDETFNEAGDLLGLDNPSFDIGRDNYTFSRHLTALSLNFPIKKTMNIGLNILKAKDNIQSVYAEVPGAIIEIPSALNDFIREDSESYLHSTETIMIEETVVCEGLETDPEECSEIEIGEEIIISVPQAVNYISYENIKNNYSKIFNETLIGEGFCIDNEGNILTEYLNQNDCELNGQDWVLSGVCYVIEIDPDTGEEIITEDTLDGLTNQVLCENNGGSWSSYFNINFKDSDWGGVKPKDNFVFGGDFEAFFDEQKLKFQTGFSFSLLNENTWDPILTYASLDTLGGDPEGDGALAGYDIPQDLDFSSFEDIFQTGINQVPLIPLDIISGDISLLKILTMPSLAYYISFEGDYSGHKIAYKMKQVGPEYNTLGNVYLQQDIREQTLSDKIGLLDNKLYLNLRYKFLEEGISFDNEEKGVTNKFDILINFSPGAGLPRLSSALGYQTRNNGVRENDFIEYEISDEEQVIDIDSRKEHTEMMQYNFALTTPFEFYGKQNLTISYYSSLTNDLVADDNILFSIESDELYDAFPYISPRTETNTFNLNLKSDFNPFLSSVMSCSRTFFDYGEDISSYYDVLEQNQNIFDDTDYDYDTALANVDNFKLEYGDILYQKQVLNSFDLEFILKSYLIFDQIKVGGHFSTASGVIEFDQYGFSVSLLRNIFDTFYINLDYDAKTKNVLNEDNYSNSYFVVRFGYNF